MYYRHCLQLAVRNLKGNRRYHLFVFWHGRFLLIYRRRGSLRSMSQRLLCHPEKPSLLCLAAVNLLATIRHSIWLWFFKFCTRTLPHFKLVLVESNLRKKFRNIRICTQSIRCSYQCTFLRIPNRAICLPKVLLYHEKIDQKSGNLTSQDRWHCISCLSYVLFGLRL